MKIQAIKDLYQPCAPHWEPPFLAKGETATIIKNATSGSLSKIKPNDFYHIRRDLDGEILKTFGSRFMDSVVEKPMKSIALKNLKSFFNTFAELAMEEKVNRKKADEITDKRLW